MTKIRLSKKSYCNISAEPDYTGVQIITPVYSELIADYKQAMVLAKGRKLNNITITTEIDRKERMPPIEKSP